MSILASLAWIYTRSTNSKHWAKTISSCLCRETTLTTLSTVLWNSTQDSKAETYLLFPKSTTFSAFCYTTTPIQPAIQAGFTFQSKASKQSKDASQSWTTEKLVGRWTLSLGSASGQRRDTNGNGGRAMLCANPIAICMLLAKISTVSIPFISNTSSKLKKK
jgi:hypothetical protein